MNKTRQIVMATLLLIGFVLTGSKAKAQTNAQLFYDFGSDRKFVTLTLEMFKADKWGNTYFFVDHDFNYDDHVEGEPRTRWQLSGDCALHKPVAGVGTEELQLTGRI